MFRFRHTLVSGFPRMWLNIRIPCTASHSPLIKPDVRISLIRLSWKLSPGAYMQRCGITPARCFGLSAKSLPQKEQFHRGPDSIHDGQTIIHRFFRSCVETQTVVHSYRRRHVSSKAPSLHGNYPASSLLWASPTPDQGRTRGYSFPQGVVGESTPCRVSQVPLSIFPRVLSPTTPESPTVAYACCFTAGNRLQHLWKTGHSRACVTRPNRVRLRYGSRVRRSRLRTRRITPSCARLATCQTGNSHDGHLSVHKIDQVYPGTPKPQRCRFNPDCVLRDVCRGL